MTSFKISRYDLTGLVERNKLYEAMYAFNHPFKARLQAIRRWSMHLFNGGDSQ
jgi:hypothetical protein